MSKEVKCHEPGLRQGRMTFPKTGLQTRAGRQGGQVREKVEGDQGGKGYVFELLGKELN